jgi:hypothetical protein
VAGIHPVENKGKFFIVGDDCIFGGHGRRMQVSFFQTFPERDGVAHSGQAAHDGAFAQGD